MIDQNSGVLTIGCEQLNCQFHTQLNEAILPMTIAKPLTQCNSTHTYTHAHTHNALSLSLSHTHTCTHTYTDPDTKTDTHTDTQTKCLHPYTVMALRNEIVYIYTRMATWHEILSLLHTVMVFTDIF